MDDLIKATEAAELLGCSKFNIARLAQLGTLPTAKKDAGERGARWFNRADVETLKRHRKTAVGTANPTKDEEIIAYVIATFVNRGVPPTVREIGKEFGWSSSSTAHKRLNRMVNVGKLSRIGKGPAACFVPPVGTWSVVMETVG